MFTFDPPENIRKPKVSGGSKGKIGKKRDINPLRPLFQSHRNQSIEPDAMLLTI